uniref:Adhesion G protein-coupled receptor G6 n=1 Tax=Acanthochromis polyacanthus TaxID=80966 RepID=A0A3Q1GTC1_9TELE
MNLSPPVLGCSSTNCNLVLTDAQGEITSPCYPQKYPNSQACKWVMQAPAGFIIQLSFLDFDLEEAHGCIYDRVVVNTGNTDVKFCGLTANGLTLNSTGNVMELSFTSDFSIQKRGFSVSFRHVTVALRNQKVKITGGSGQVTKVANSVTIPTLNQLTICFEVERISQKQKEWFFTYYDRSNNVSLSLGSDQTKMMMIIDGVTCPIDSIISPSDFTTSMMPFCVLWTSSNGRVAAYFNGNYWSCGSIFSNAAIRLCVICLCLGQHNFNGNIYNLRLWDYAMDIQQLAALTCDTVGNVIDWDNNHWTIPSTVAQTDLNQTFQNWTHTVYIDNIRYSNTLTQKNCPQENPLHYRWPETRPNVTQYLPCFPNKDQSTSRTWYHTHTHTHTPTPTHNSEDFTLTENAAEVADQLKVITNNELSNEEVSKVVTIVKQLVNVAKINTTLARTVVTIISNVMTSSETALSATSEKALKTVDELVQKIEFEGQSISITSKHLAVGISALNSTVFSGMSFSAFMSPNTTNPQIDFDSERVNSLAQITLPPSLLSSVSLNHSVDGRSLNSYVVASSVGNFSISNLMEPVEIEIAHLPDQPSLNPVCMFWDFNGTGGWNGAGCSVSPESTSNKTICLCTHLTHFGILMDISGASPSIDQKNNKILTFITYIGCGISAIFSAATLLTYIAFEKLRRDYPSKILMNLSTSLLFLNMVFLLDGWLASLETEWLCLSVAVFLHYFLLTSFTWMGLESIHMYIALVKVFNTYIRRYILKFCIVGWGELLTVWLKL